MACCKCKEYRWVDHQEVHGEDSSGREFCLFHAPRELKKKGERDFNDFVFQRMALISSTLELPTYNFNGTIFPWKIDFGRFKENFPLPELFLSHCKFYGRTSFSGCHFAGATWITNSDFYAYVNYNTSTFHAEAKFFDTKFHLGVSFYKTKFLNKVSFDNVRFCKCKTTPETNNSNQIHTQNTSNSAVKFEDMQFFNDVSFQSSEFDIPTNYIGISGSGNITFDRAKFNANTIFSRILNNTKISFLETNMHNVNIINSTLENIRFKNVIWDTLRYKGRYTIPLDESTSHATDYANSMCNLTTIADFYRQMKKRCRDEQNDAEASLWHYAEKEAQLKLHRLEKPSSFQRWMLEAYRIISRYGEDPWQALTVLWYMLVLLFFILCLGSIAYLGPLPAEITWSKVGKFFHSYFQYVLFINPTYPATPVFAGLALLLSRLFIPVQAAIFAFALRNKLHR